MGLADLHMHTIYSYDGTASVAAVLRRAKQIGLDVIAITDHDEMAGATLAQELAVEIGIQVIPGVEITTSEGDLLALFVRKPIAPGFSLIETLMKIGEQGGIAIAPHPMAAGLGMKSLKGISIVRAHRHSEAGRVLVGIEAYNATALDRESNRFGRILAERAELAQIGNSDAHTLAAIGMGRTEFPGRTIEDLVVALHNHTTHAQAVGRPLNPIAILGNWAASYMSAMPTRLALSLR